MKAFLFTAMSLLHLGMQAQNQITFGVRAGLSPAVSPGTNHLIANRNDPAHTFIFNIDKVIFTPQAGLVLRSEGTHFWFMGEALFGQSTSTYVVQPIWQDPAIPEGPQPVSQQPGRDAVLYDEKVSFVDIPVSAGVKLGRLEIFSGIHATFELTHESELEQLPEISRSVSPGSFGWHSGVGLNFKHILLDFRYQQHFSNYGQGLFAGGQELLLKNAPGRITASVAFLF